MNRHGAISTSPWLVTRFVLMSFGGQFLDTESGRQISRRTIDAEREAQQSGGSAPAAG